VAQSLNGCEPQIKQSLDEVRQWLQNGDEGLANAKETDNPAEETITLESGDVMLF
jgi:uncharacterized protein YgiM (DUF1202 family)